MCEEWQVVKGRGRGRRRRPESDKSLECRDVIMNSKKAVRPEGLEDRLRKRRDELSDSTWWREMAGSVIKDIPVADRVVCYGLGSIFESRNAQWQFALVLLLCERCNKSRLEIYDPVLTADEMTFLAEFANCHEAAPVDTFQIREEEKSIFVFMPHCPAALYAKLIDVIESSRIGRLFLLGNSLTAYHTRTPDRKLQPQLRRALACLASEQNLDPGRSYPDLERAFSDTALHTFRDEDRTAHETPGGEFTS